MHDASRDQELGRRIRRGDTAALHELATAYLPVAQAIARTHLRKFGGDEDELQSESAVALMQAARAYDPDRGPFQPFLRNTVRLSLKKHTTRTLPRQKPAMKVKSGGGWANAPTLPLSPTIEAGLVTSDKEPKSNGKSYTAELCELLGRLTAEERRAVVLRYGLDGQGERTWKHIADVLRISFQDAFNLAEKAMRRMRGELPSATDQLTKAA